MLLNPDYLADWTLAMLDPQVGIYGSGRGQNQSQVPGQYQPGTRPSFPPMPAPGGGGQADGWAQLEHVLNTNPAQAWQVIDRMQAQDFQARPMFVPN